MRAHGRSADFRRKTQTGSSKIAAEEVTKKTDKEKGSAKPISDLAKPFFALPLTVW